MPPRVGHCQLAAFQDGALTACCSELLFYPSDGSPGAVGTCVDLSSGHSIVFTVNGEWPCAAPQTSEPTAAPTPHHHHHDGALADFRDAALGSLVVAALTAAVLL